MSEPLSIARVRELIGARADGKTDEEIAALRDRFEVFARAFIGVCDDRERAARAART
jgi:hypothetical protein